MNFYINIAYQLINQFGECGRSGDIIKMMCFFVPLYYYYVRLPVFLCINHSVSVWT